MTTLADLRTETLNILYGLDDFEHPLADRIDGPIADATTEVVAFDTPALWEPDDWVEYQDNGEITRLVDDTTQLRAQKGTTGASHVDDTVVLKNPPFYQYQVDQQIKKVVRNELWDGGDGVWTWHQDSFTPSDTDFMYDLDTYIEDVVMLYQYNIDADNRFRPLPPGWWDVERQVDSGAATNSNLLIVHKVVDYDEDVYYTAKRRPHVDDLDNLSDEIADLIPLAAAAQCIVFRSPQIKQAAHRNASRSDSSLLQDYRAIRSAFILDKETLHRNLLKEVRPDMRWRPVTRAFRRSW